MPESPKQAANQPNGPASIDVSSPIDAGPAMPDTPEHPSLPKIVPFTDLARCGEEIWISHQGQLYRLQSTRAGKLILTK